MMRRYLTSALVVALAIMFAGLPVQASNAGMGWKSSRQCESEKSLFANISTPRLRGVEVGLLVAWANALPADMGGQAAELHIFFADAAAPFGLRTEFLDEYSKELNEHFKEEGFGYTVDDVIEVQTHDTVIGDYGPDRISVAFLQDMYGARVYGCMKCLLETINAALSKVKPNPPPDYPVGPEALGDYLLPGVEVMTPMGFAVLYDRVERRPYCNVEAAVISF
jgi:hypothetical protein